MEVEDFEDGMPGYLLNLCCIVIAAANQDCSLHFAICSNKVYH